jgi:Zn-dependent protease with chaperone function/tetratricopeptide (TPR) repeat protein
LRLLCFKAGRPSSESSPSERDLPVRDLVFRARFRTMNTDGQPRAESPLHATEPTAPGARPLNSSAKALLILSACAMIALCYLFSLGAMVVLLLFLAVELLIVVLLLRFGMVSIIAPVIERHGALLTLFARSLWLRKGEQGRVPLSRDEAPRLFAILESLAERLGIAVPREVVVEMNVGAWVELRGWRQGSRATRLGVGYDLLVGLTEAEVEAVLAHEMAHARLVRRGLRTWLGGGFARIANLTNQLSARQEEFRRAKKSFATGEACLTCADACTRGAAKLVAAYSRQDEFEADLGAAQLCGSAALRSALGKLHSLSTGTARLGWHERMAKLQQGEGYAVWLRDELSAEASATGDQPDEIATDPYSTHPSIPDRLAALPPAEGPAPDSPPAIGLIVNADALAGRIISEIERIATIHETRDDKELRTLARKIRSGAATRHLQMLAMFIVVGSLFFGLFAFFDRFNPWIVLFALAGISGGVWLYRFGRYKITFPLAVPAFGQIQNGLETIRGYTDLGAEEKQIEARLKEGIANLPVKQATVFYQKQAFAALAACNYLEAHVAGRLGLGLDAKSIPCALAFLIAAGSLRQNELVGKNLYFLRQQTGIRTPDTLWGAAWSLYLADDWSSAEALLSDLLKLRPDDVTVHLLLSSCAANRGKRQTALAHSRTAVELAPADLDAIKLLMAQLIDCGYLREAIERIEKLPLSILEHPSLRLTRIRVHLLRRDFDAAHSLETPMLQEAAGDAALRLQLAASHEGMRRHDRAWQLYEEVTRLGHYPEALVGLGRLSNRRGQRDEARRHLLSSLNTKIPVGPKAVPPLAFFGAVLAELSNVRGPGIPCKAWILTFIDSEVAGPLAKQAFVIFGRNESEAIADMKILADAIIPENTLKTEHIELRLAPNDRQPVGAVIPGVQYVWQ